MSIPTSIKVLALDVDGVLTDGTIRFSPPHNQEIKSFHVHDGLGISMWQKMGNHVILISGRSAECVSVRARELGIQHVYQGCKDKIATLDTALALIGETTHNTCFVGDDLGDIPVMQHVQFSIAVHNAVEEVREYADMCTSKCGGDGAVREIVECLMRASNTWDACIASLQTEHAKQ
jgi:3-deoxy-D-manno-octulosonate 8-phosphate phosphatase (KDO 8-P phosphatase)